MLQIVLLSLIALLAAKALLIGSEFNFILWLSNWRDYPNWYFSRETWQQYCIRNSKETRSNRESLWAIPWHDPAFDGWHVYSMHHCRSEGRYTDIRIDMENSIGGQIVSASGVDDEFIWDDLAKKVKEYK